MSYGSVEELLDHPALDKLTPYFLKCDYNDMELLCDMEPEDWDDMLAEVDKLASQDGVVVTPGVKARVKSRLRKEKSDRAASSWDDTAGAAPRQRDPASKLPSAPVAARVDTVGSGASTGSLTKSYLFWSGFTCTDANWVTCLTICIFSLLVSIFFWQMSVHVHNSDGSNDQASEDNGWRFLFVVAVIGWVVCGIAFCFCLCAYRRQSDVVEEVPCPGLPSCGDLGGVCTGLCSAISEICSSCSEALCSCLSFDCSCSGGFQCPDCSCDSCLPSCDDCFIPDCGVPDFHCDCSHLTQCGCCPDCGNVRSCFHTTVKILTCQCQIQV